MKLNDISPAEGAKKDKMRVGRGVGSGKGKTAGRGMNGQRSRSGFSRKRGFEGGQTPLFQRLPKRGFSNVNFRVSYDIINVGDLNLIPDGVDVVNLDLLADNGMVKKKHSRLKILGSGTLEKKLVVEAARFSKSAQAQIEKCGGEAKTV